MMLVDVGFDFIWRLSKNLPKTDEPFCGVLYAYHHHFWQAPLRVRSAKRRHQSPELYVFICL